MTQAEQRRSLIEYLLAEEPQYRQLTIPAGEPEQKALLRALCNVRPPRPTDEGFLRIQDAYLQAALHARGITDYRTLSPIEDGIYLWRGDITTLRCDAIVNAANRQMLGCFCPNHGCIDNAIHTFAGVQLRAACAERMHGTLARTGEALLTPAFNLPCRYVLHTVGPVIQGPVRARDEAQLASCYRACLQCAEENGLESVAFCCISTGEFHFPNGRAAEIAVQTVRSFRETSQIEVIFNVFKPEDEAIYRALLG